MKPMRRPDAVLRRSGRLSLSTVVVLGALLALPGYALARLAPPIDVRALVAAAIALSGFAFLAYRSDKRSAEAGEWRVPESTLHFMALIGGWPGAFLAQRAFRHKTAKASFQVVFWAIVLLHQLIAADSLMGWRFTREAWRVFAVKSG